MCFLIRHGSSISGAIVVYIDSKYILGLFCGMIHFIELHISKAKPILVNIDKVLNIFENKDGRTVMVQSGEENFSVDENYKEVTDLLKSIDGVNILPTTK